MNSLDRIQEVERLIIKNKDYLISLYDEVNFCPCFGREHDCCGTLLNTILEVERDNEDLNRELKELEKKKMENKND